MDKFGARVHEIDVGMDGFRSRVPLGEIPFLGTIKE